MQAQSASFSAKKGMKVAKKYYISDSENEWLWKAYIAFSKKCIYRLVSKTTTYHKVSVYDGSIKRSNWIRILKKVEKLEETIRRRSMEIFNVAH